MRTDLGFALRQILKNPAFALTAIAILALGIGSSAAVFSALYQALLKPLPYADPDRLVFLHNSFPQSQVALAGVSSFDYSELRKRREVFSQAGIYYFNDLTLTGVGDARHIDAVNASASLFEVFGVKPELGRTFSEADDRYGAAKTALLSDAFWRSAFAADPNIVGRLIHLDGKPYAVIGVMPPTFQFPYPATQLWIPVGLRASAFTIQGGRLEKWLHMVARLTPDASASQADAALQTVGSALASTFPMFYPAKSGWRFVARPLTEEQTSAFRRWLYLAFGAVFSVLLIACINVSGLLVIRAAARNGELAVRTALGASRWRIVRQMLAETGVLVFAGCALGLLLAAWAVRLINLYGPLPQPAAIQSWTVLFAIALGLVTTLGAGLIPATLSAALPVNEILKSGASRTVSRGGVWRNATVALQIALAVILLFTAASLSRSFLNLTRVPVGFERARIWSGAIELPRGDFQELLTQLNALPAVQSASGANIPFNPSGVWTEQLHIENRPKTDPPPEAQIGIALPGYFETMKIELLSGRTFTEDDRAGSQPVAVIDEELARRYFPNENALGKKLGSGGADKLATVVGVVRSVRNSDLGGPLDPQIYYPELQERSAAMYLALRMKNDSDPTAAVRRIIAKLYPSVALYDVQFMSDRIDASLGLRRFIALLLNAFALAGIGLAAVGLYASLAHLVQLRTREIGIRLALGARQSQVLQLVLGRAGTVAGVGLALGTAGALISGRIVRGQLFGVQATDAGTWAIVLGVLIVAAAVAAWLPGRRATRVDPSIALREE